MTFELPLAEEKVKPHQVTALHLLAALAFVGAGAVFYLFYKPAQLPGIALIVAGGLILLISLLRNKWLVTSKAGAGFRIIELVISLGLTGFSAFHKWTPAIVMFGVLSAAILFALFWEQNAGGIPTIKLDDAGVKLPVTSRKRFISWPEIDQVLFKYGTLTINCCDNRLFQWTIQKMNIDKEKFELFCAAQIEAGKKRRDKNDW